MNKMVMSVITALLFTQIVACAPVNKEGIGTVVGGVAGGLIGSRFGSGGGRAAAIAGGAIIGAVIGNKIGQYMDRTDRLEMMQAMEHAPDNHPVQWQNPNTHASYEVTPIRTYGSDVQPCREYQSVATIAGKKQRVYGTACREADGSWRIQNA